MKVMITSKGDSLESLMDERFGRAEYFIIYDTQNDEFEAIKNPYLNDRGGVGVSISKFTIEKNVDALISGSFGPNAQDVLKASNIKLYSTKDITVKQAVERLKNNELKEFVN